MAKLTFGGDRGKYLGDGKYEEFESSVLEIGMKEADLSSKNLGVGGAIIAGAWISHKDNGALAKLTFGGDGEYYNQEQGKTVPYEPAR